MCVFLDEDVSQPPQLSSPPAEMAEPPGAPIAVPLGRNESVSEPELANDEDPAAIKRAMIAVMGPKRAVLADWLTAQGLAPEDGERIAQRFLEGLADCLLEAVRNEHEARGNPDQRGMSWTQVLAYVNLNRIQSAAVPCASNISQQTGIPLPASFGSGGSRRDDIPEETPAPPWAPEMEARIRDYVASYSEPAIRSVIVECDEPGCNVTLVGRDIRIFELDFDVFAEQNGFKHAVLRGDSDSRFVWLQR